MATNDYVLKYTGQEIDNLLAQVESGNGGSSLKFEIVTELPTTNIDTATIYLVQTSSGEYNEWIFVNNTWEMLGNTEMDLTNYATKEYVEESIENIPDAQTIITYINEPVNFVDGTKPEYANGWYVFTKGVTFNGEDASSANGGWIDANTLIYVRNYTNSVYFNIIAPYRMQSNDNLAIYKYYLLSDEKWYPTAATSAYNKTVLTTSTGLSKTNTTKYTPSEDYHPATKKYVDDTTMPASDVINSFWKGTQAEYDALETKSETTLYIIKEG